MQLPDGPQERILSFADKTKCSTCHEGGLYVWYLPVAGRTVYLVACEACGKVFYNGDSAQEARESLGKHRMDQDRLKETALDRAEVYEANKTRSHCVACGKKTVERALFATTINYCPCVEK